MNGDESVFDLLEIYIGDDLLRARPVKWSSEEFNNDGYDEAGGQVIVTAYETVCSHCSQLLQFSAEEIRKGDGYLWVQCTNCEVGDREAIEEAKPASPKKDHIDIKRIADKASKKTNIPALIPPSPKPGIEMPIVIIDEGCPFQDPVIAGELKQT